MNQEELLAKWLKEEEIAHIQGWDFSHIHGRYREEEDLPWDFGAVVTKYLQKDDRLLDMETGGGEFLLTFQHDPHLTSAIEGYEPNIKVCEERLCPLGIDFKAADGGDPLPFPDRAFDVITNRHGNYEVSEIRRTLQSGGYFLTQQVGAENDRALVELLLGKVELPFPQAYLAKAKRELQEGGFTIIECAETYRPIEFFDVGALVWYARIIEWEFPGFSVERCRDNLLKVQALLEREGSIKGSIHRYYLVAQKA